MDVDATARLRGVVNRLSRQFNASARHEGLTPTQASVLGLIAFRESMSLTDVATLEGLNPTMVSRVIGRLDELGLIVRQPSAADLRVTLVALTPEGQAMHKRVKQQKGQVIADGLDRLDDADQASIMAALPALEALSGALSPRPRPSGPNEPR
ncbi:MarR family winged helix-turn-helix transcriptional regulator [Humibacter sp. RRB41]|uniref:MarR family winged helix-turn-helix transcriptional regulator n=1 Tax=Humibacter sp. RRB41 TaxID=2919946 RepID=UPI001FAA6C8D|nr:MarR family transcriptional regulator [Humibacter sp. RRB41]